MDLQAMHVTNGPRWPLHSPLGLVGIVIVVTLGTPSDDGK